LHPEDKDHVVNAVQHVVDSGGLRWTARYRFQCKDGSYATVLDQGSVIRDACGRALRVIGGIRDISEREKAEEALARSHHQLRALSARLESAREDERKRVAREIHDELGQVLTALKINLDWLERRIGERQNDPSLNQIPDRIVESSAIVETATANVQKIALELRPVLLDSFGLAPAIQQEAERFQQRTDFKIHWSLGC
jgi:two-component system sensor histidine kinase UhpB